MPKKPIIITKPKLIRIVEILEQNFDIYRFAKMIRYMATGITEEDSYIIAMILMKQLEYLGDQLFDQEDYWGE